MASGIYNRFKYNLLIGRADLEDVSGEGSDTIKCALLNSTHGFDVDHNYWSNISANQASGAGYTTGGATLANKNCAQDDTNNRASFDADDVTWSSSTITARYGVLYNLTKSNELIACFDFGQDYSSSNGNFTISWHANGILLLT